LNKSNQFFFFCHKGKTLSFWIVAWVFFHSNLVNVKSVANLWIFVIIFTNTFKGFVKKIKKWTLIILFFLQKQIHQQFYPKRSKLFILLKIFFFYCWVVLFLIFFCTSVSLFGFSSSSSLTVSQSKSRPVNRTFLKSTRCLSSVSKLLFFRLDQGFN
jgi:hypothetical protein